MRKTWILWILAIVITAAAAFYQRMTGPTYPKNRTIDLAGQELKLKLLTSSAGKDDCKMEFETDGKAIDGKVFYKRYPSSDDWSSKAMSREDDKLIVTLPVQPQAGKLAYYLEFEYEGNEVSVEKEDPVIIRFRGDVPAWIMIPHILLMFLSMLFANMAGLLVLAKKTTYRLWGNIAFLVMLVGGMIFGPLMQKHAFGEYWTGIPNGWDLTDNKTLIAVVFWLLAVALNLKKRRPAWVLVASIVTLIIFSIPHSVLGSEFNYQTNEVVTGMIGFLKF